MAMDKGYENDLIRKTMKNMGFTPVVPPGSNRKEPWWYNKTIYKRRNGVKRLFYRIKGFKCIWNS
jgi:transposase